jgi:hypothetical protein
MIKPCCLILVLVNSISVLAEDKTYYLNRHSGEMAKSLEDQTTLNLSFHAKHTDNYLYQNEDEVSTSYFEFNPSLKAQYHNDSQMLQLGLWAKARKVNDYSEDENTDSFGLTKYHLKFTENQSMVLSAAFFDYYLERGIGLSKGEGAELKERDHQKSNFVNIAHQMGNEDSNATLTSMFGVRDTDYKNRVEVTKALNLSSKYVLFDFQYQFSGRTYLTSKVAFEDIEHDLGTQQDRNISSALVGIKWHKTEFTHFEFAAGALKIDFDEGNLANKNEFKWDAKLRWSPIEQLEFSFFSLRSVDENRQVQNSYLISDKFGLNAIYRYTDNVEFYFQNSIDKLEYYFEEGNETEDTIASEFTIFYKFRANMSVSLAYSYQELDSKVQNNNFERNTVNLGFSFVI